MVNKVFKNVSLLEKVYSVGVFLYKEFFKKREDAEKQYKNLYPLQRITFTKAGRDSSEFNNLLNAFLSLTPVGTNRMNFKRRYIDDKSGWSNLSKDPTKIPYGHGW
jgi:hypothetical protein